jgi:hypothetical protein
MGEERRKSPRVVVDATARLTIGNETIDGRVRDICRDAALVETERSFPLQTEVTLETELPKVTGAIRASGRVIRHARGHDGAQAMAILFDDISAEATLRIDLFVSEQDV